MSGFVWVVQEINKSGIQSKKEDQRWEEKPESQNSRVMDGYSWVWVLSLRSVGTPIHNLQQVLKPVPYPRSVKLTEVDWRTSPCLCSYWSCLKYTRFADAHILPSRFFGTKPFARSSVFYNQPPQSSFVTTKPPSWLPIIQNFMHVANSMGAVKTMVLRPQVP